METNSRRADGMNASEGYKEEKGYIWYGGSIPVIRAGIRLTNAPTEQIIKVA
jgi:hypothetical protein